MQVVAEAQRLELLQQNPAGAMHNRLGRAGRARGVEDPQRMVEGDRLEGERRVGRRDGILPGDQVALSAHAIMRDIGIVDQDRRA